MHITYEVHTHTLYTYTHPLAIQAALISLLLKAGVTWLRNLLITTLVLVPVAGMTVHLPCHRGPKYS